MFTSSTRTRLRINRPAPTSRTQANATSDTTSALRIDFRRRPSVDPRLASFSASWSAEVCGCSAGASPKTTPVRIATATVNPRTVASIRRPASKGMLTASRCASARVPAIASNTPSRPPVPASTSPSVSICATSRRRPAPSAVRMAISFCRAAVRASSRFERFAHTISITMPTAPGEHPQRQADPATDLVGRAVSRALRSSFGPGFPW